MLGAPAVFAAAISLALGAGTHAAGDTVGRATRAIDAVDSSLARPIPRAPKPSSLVARTPTRSANAVPTGASVDAVGAAASMPAASAGTNGSAKPPPSGSTANEAVIAQSLKALSAQSTSPTATLVNGIAFAPAGAPPAVEGVIGAANMISDLPYVWGGGHGSWYASGYDCSGAVSFALHGGGLLNQPMTSGSLESYGAPGPGRWITIYANSVHAYAVIAGLRWDTVGDARGTGPRWHAEPPYPAGFVVRHPVGY